MSAVATLYAIIDTAVDDRLYDLVQLCGTRECLFAGKVEEPLVRAAPWMVALRPQEHLFHAWRDIGRDKAWGLLVRSELGFADLRRHFRHFTQAMLPDGDVILFRFYDPRVMKVYLPTCNADELQQWFKGVSSMLVETGEGGHFHDFRLVDGALRDASAV